jgi:hypothetical protein
MVGARPADTYEVPWVKPAPSTLAVWLNAFCDFVAVVVHVAFSTLNLARFLLHAVIADVTIDFLSVEEVHACYFALRGPRGFFLVRHGFGVSV